MNKRARPVPRSARSAGDPFAGFRTDHVRVLAYLSATERAVLGPHGLRPGAHERLRAFVALLEQQFATHMTTEDALLFPALAEVMPESRAILAPLAEDHAEMRSLLASLAEALAARAGRARDERIGVQLRDLLDLLRLHIQREERTVFDVAERILSPVESRDLAARLSRFVAVLSPVARSATRKRRSNRTQRERKP